MRKKRPKIVVESYTGKHFRALATLIGQASLAWNGLHEHLGQLFWEAMGHDTGSALNVWYSSYVDRSKRKMLEAAIPYMALRWQIGFPALVADMKWLLAEAEKLEDTRNNVIHSPLALVLVEEMEPGIKPYLKVVPASFHGNPRAQRLDRKDLTAEYKWCRDTANALTLFAKAVLISLVIPEYAWPDRPKLPIRKERKPRKSRRSSQ